MPEKKNEINMKTIT